MKTAFVGGGVMAEAILSRAIDNHLLDPSSIHVAEPVDERRAFIRTTYSVVTHSSNRDAIHDADLIVLAIKPQQTVSVFNELAGLIHESQTCLSIVAGVPISKLREGLRHEKIIRVMPNTPAQIGEAMSVWTATPQVSDVARAGAADLLATLGHQREVSDESYIDMATAISGSGPAYVFAFIEALVQAGINIGIPSGMALDLTLQTVYGAARLAKVTGDDPAVLRERVTSPGGTTAAAMNALIASEFGAVIESAVRAAHRRAQELGGNA